MQTNSIKHNIECVHTSLIENLQYLHKQNEQTRLQEKWLDERHKRKKYHNIKKNKVYRGGVQRKNYIWYKNKYPYKRTPERLHTYPQGNYCREIKGAYPSTNTNWFSNAVCINSIRCIRNKLPHLQSCHSTSMFNHLCKQNRKGMSLILKRWKQNLHIFY